MVTIVKKLSIMGLTNTQWKNSSSTRDLSKYGIGAKPRGQEFFNCMHVKKKARYNFAQMEMEWWNEVEKMNIIDNGSNHTFLRNIFLLFRAFFQEHFMIFLDFC